MNKISFRKIIKEQIVNLPLEKTVIILDSVPEWVKEIKASILKDMFYCSKCRKYSKNRNIKQITAKEISCGECVYSDAGYGDSDEFADVEYIITYNICPLCGEKHYKNRQRIGTFNRRDRWGKST